MSKGPMHSLELGRAKSTTAMFDTCAVVAISGCVFALIVSPLLVFFTSELDQKLQQGLLASRIENRFFWPVLSAICVVLIVQNLSRLPTLTLPSNIICLIAYLAFAGASISWAFSPELSFTRFVQQVMVITSIVLPVMLAARTTDMMRALFLCFAFASILNVFFVFGRRVTIDNNEHYGFAGYVSDKNALGQIAAIAFLLALYELFRRGLLRRAFGLITVIIAMWLLFMSKSKTSLGLAFGAPLLAGLALTTGRMLRVSVATILLSVLVCYAALSSVSDYFSMSRVSYLLYENATFSGRIYIWDFARTEIARRPLLGWGYQSFWFVGPGGPSIVDAPDWIKNLPHAHSGYWDTILETGYVGFALFVIFIVATLYAIGRVANRDPTRGWLLLSIALFIILDNFLETVWMRGFHTLWLVFLFIAAETGRYWNSPLTKPADGSRLPRVPGPRQARRGLSRPTSSALARPTRPAPPA